MDLKMKTPPQIVACFDIDDCLFPSDNTYFGPVDDANEILALNMKRVKMMLEKWDMKVFITSAWYTILEIHDGVLGYEREEHVRNGGMHIVEEYKAFKTLRDGFGDRVIGLSCGERMRDIVNLLNGDNIVIAFDDIDLSTEKILKVPSLKDSIDKEKFKHNYLYVQTLGFITNRLTFYVNEFMKTHVKV